MINADNCGCRSYRLTVGRGERKVIKVKAAVNFPLRDSRIPREDERLAQCPLDVIGLAVQRIGVLIDD